MSDPNLAAVQTATVQGPRLLDQVREIAFARFGRAEPGQWFWFLPAA